MRKSNASVTVYREKNDLERISYSKECTTKMSTNPATSNPDVPYADVITAANDAKIAYDAIDEVGSGSRAERELLKSKMSVLDALFVKNINYASRMANGDVALITALGFTPTSTTRNAKPAPTIVTNLNLTAPSASGTILIDSDIIAVALVYVTVLSVDATALVKIDKDGWRLETTNVGKFKVFQSTTPRLKVTGLDSGERIYVQRFAYNGAGNGPVCAVVNIITQ